MNKLIDPKQLGMSQLRDKVFSTPTTRDVRPYVVEYLRRQTDRARTLTNEDLLHGKGADISSSMFGALALQGSDGAEGVDWITKEAEPTLFRMMLLASRLDVDDNNDQATWDELFKIVDKL